MQNTFDQTEIIAGKVPCTVRLSNNGFLERITKKNQITSIDSKQVVVWLF